MSQDTQVLFALVVYLTFFGWIGWRRGLRSELTVFIVALLAWVLLQERGNIFVRITNLGIKFVGLLGTSLATGEVNEGALASQADFVPAGSEDTFLFLLWIVLLFGTYVITSRPSFAKASAKGGWAVIVGGLNGMLLLAVLLPKLNALYANGTSPTDETTLQTFTRLLSSTFTSLVASIQSFWEWVSPLSPMALLVFIMAILGLTAFTLRSGAKAKPKG